MKTKNYLFKGLLLAALSLFLYSSTKWGTNDNVQITYELPVDVSIGASESDFAYFAWQEFIALNWKSSWDSDGNRTTPDKNWNFATGGGQPDLAVWETYIHRTELRPANGVRSADLSTGLPQYSFIDQDSIDYSGIVPKRGFLSRKSRRNQVTETSNDPSVLNNYWNVLDEDNEIGSAYVFAHENEYEVMYAAKSNLVEYDYVKKYFPSDTLLERAGNLGISKQLPYFLSLTREQMCKSDSISSNPNCSLICLPCSDSSGEGSIEIKLAFRQLDYANGDDPEKYITKTAIVFKNNTTNPQYKLTAEKVTFALIGMHIIRKTANHPTFIFASWEHVDERNKNTQTIGIDDVTVNGIQYEDEDPHRLNPVIERVIPETIQKVNDVVHASIISENPASKLQHYQLIGVQGTPTDYTDRTSDNNYFMANYVIESDLKLTNFHGSFSDPFNTSVLNVVSDHKAFNMGGCMGCHGQAQVSFGTDFSFLLDFGAGKPVPLPDPYQTYQEALQAANPGLDQLSLIKQYIQKLDSLTKN